MSGSEQGERTEEATPEKQQRAREEGQFARTKDGGAVAASAAVLLCMLALGTTDVGVIKEFALYCFTSPTALIGGSITPIGQRVAGVLLAVIVPMCVAAAAGGAAVGLFESGLLFRLELLSPNFERLNPISRIGQLFSPKQGFTNVVSALLRVAVLGTVTALVVKDAFPDLSKLARAELSAAVVTVLHVGLRLATWSILALGCLAALDYGQSFWRIKKELMMTLQELKEEMHQQEGDPKVKAKIRARARELARRGIAKEVKRSDVVIANPTHICIALRYRPAEGAPVVTAKGYDEVAFYIRRLAEEHGIPVVEDRPLARALAESAKVGRMIPVDMYQAVAKVLAFVYRMRGRGIKS
ncbi:MAG TPA: EscU/YscU/HrcU family type III secretion system export apparatus switch protein [Polyangiaceae bacterium]